MDPNCGNPCLFDGYCNQVNMPSELMALEKVHAPSRIFELIHFPFKRPSMEVTILQRISHVEKSHQRRFVNYSFLQIKQTEFRNGIEDLFDRYSFEGIQIDGSGSLFQMSI